MNFLTYVKNFPAAVKEYDSMKTAIMLGLVSTEERTINIDSINFKLVYCSKLIRYATFRLEAFGQSPLGGYVSKDRSIVLPDLNYVLDLPTEVSDFIILHEIGHMVELKGKRPIMLYNTLRQVKSMFNKVLECELAADLYAAKKMGKNNAAFALDWLYLNTLDNEVLNRKNKLLMSTV